MSHLIMGHQKRCRLLLSVLRIGKSASVTNGTNTVTRWKSAAKFLPAVDRAPNDLDRLIH